MHLQTPSTRMSGTSGPESLLGQGSQPWRSQVKQDTTLATFSLINDCLSVHMSVNQHWEPYTQAFDFRLTSFFPQLLYIRLDYFGHDKSAFFNVLFLQVYAFYFLDALLDAEATESMYDYYKPRLTTSSAKAADTIPWLRWSQRESCAVSQISWSARWWQGSSKIYSLHNTIT